MNWKSEGMGDNYCTIGIPNAWGGGGGLNLEFPQGTDKNLENTYFMALKSLSQMKHELVTLLKTAEEGYKTSIHRSVMFSRWRK